MEASIYSFLEDAHLALEPEECYKDLDYSEAMRWLLNQKNRGQGLDEKPVKLSQ